MVSKPPVTRAASNCVGLGLDQLCAGARGRRHSFSGCRWLWGGRTPRRSSRLSCWRSRGSWSRVRGGFTVLMADDNPLVLIHAPLYYHLAALAGLAVGPRGARPGVGGLGGGPVALVARLAGMTLAAAFRLARLGGAPRRAGWWAHSWWRPRRFTAACPFEVRPDMLGVGLQTTGVLLLLSALRTDGPAERLPGGLRRFGLAACIKQHFVVAPAISTVLLLAAWRDGRLGSKAIARVLLSTLAIVVLCYGLEEWATGGRMSRSVFAAAGNVVRIHPADWYFAGKIVLALIWKCVGIILLAAAALVAMVPARAGRAVAFSRRPVPA